MRTEPLAADVLELRVEPVGGRGARRALILVGSALYFLVSLVLQIGDLLPVQRIVISRRASGEVLVRASVAPEMRGWLLDEMRSTLATMSEPEFLDIWSDTDRWAKKFRAADIHV